MSNQNPEPVEIRREQTPVRVGQEWGEDEVPVFRVIADMGDGRFVLWNIDGMEDDWVSADYLTNNYTLIRDPEALIEELAGACGKALDLLTRMNTGKDTEASEEVSVICDLTEALAPLATNGETEEVGR